MVEIVVILAGIVLWLAGALTVGYRGFILPGVKLDDLKFEVAQRRGMFFNVMEPDTTPRTHEELRQRVIDNEVGAFAAAQGESRRFVVWQAWRGDADFKAEVRQRMREYYVAHQAYIALLCGGVWALAFVFVEPLQEALVPSNVEALFPVYVLVAPWWIAVFVIVALERVKAAQRRSKRTRL